MAGSLLSIRLHGIPCHLPIVLFAHSARIERAIWPIRSLDAGVPVSTVIMERILPHYKEYLLVSRVVNPVLGRHFVVA